MNNELRLETSRHNNRFNQQSSSSPRSRVISSTSSSHFSSSVSTSPLWSSSSKVLVYTLAEEVDRFITQSYVRLESREVRLCWWDLLREVKNKVTWYCKDGSAMGTVETSSPDSSASLVSCVETTASKAKSNLRGNSFKSESLLSEFPEWLIWLGTERRRRWQFDVVALHDLFDGSVAELATHLSFARAPFDGTVLESSLYTEEKTWAVWAACRAWSWSGVHDSRRRDVNRWTKPCLLAVLLQLHSYSLRQGLKCKKRLQRTRPAVGLFGESITNVLLILRPVPIRPLLSLARLLLLRLRLRRSAGIASLLPLFNRFQSASSFSSWENVTSWQRMGCLQSKIFKKSNSHLETNDVNHDVNRLWAKTCTCYRRVTYTNPIMGR